MTRPTEAIFYTGATGSIITNRDLLSDLVFVQSTTFRGLTGDMEVKEMGTLGGIGRVYHSPYVGMNVPTMGIHGNIWVTLSIYTPPLGRKFST